MNPIAVTAAVSPKTTGGSGYERIIHYGMGTVEIGAGRRASADPLAPVDLARTVGAVSENF